MKRKMIALTTLMLLVVSIWTMNVSASNGSYSYDYTKRTRRATEWNWSGQNWTFYAKAYPSNGSAITRLELCNFEGTTIYDYEIYPYNPVNPNYVTCTIYNNDSVSTFVKPVPNGAHTYGTIVWSF